MKLQYYCLCCGNTRLVSVPPESNTVTVPFCCGVEMQWSGTAIEEPK